MPHSRLRCQCLGRRILTAIVVFSYYGTGAAVAQLDPEATKAYRVQVVVRFAKEPLLTPIYQEQVQRALRDGLKGALGDLAVVEVVSDHPLLKTIESQGLYTAIEGWKKVSDVTTHFVLIDYDQGQYKVQTMQHDGFTGLASPVLRRAETTDRLIVARTAGLLIDQDLGVAGTVEPKPSGDEVNVILKGGGLGVPMDRWLRKGEVMAVARIQKVGAELRSERLESTLLQLLEDPDAKGRCRCKLLHRRPEPLAGKALAYRCVKLGTTRARARLKVVDASTLRPLGAVEVHIAHEGFEVKPSETKVSTSDGLVESQQPYPHVAYVKLVVGRFETARIPVEIIEGRVAVCPIKEDRQTDMLAELDLQRRRLEEGLNQSIEVLALVFNDIKETKDLDSALKKALVAQTNLNAEIDARTLEIANLDQRIKAEKMQKISVKAPQSRLDILRKRQTFLESSIAKLQEAIKTQNDPKQKELGELVRKADQRENDADYEQALATYRQLMEKAEGLAPELRKQAEAKVKDLDARWKVKSNEHASAREYIYKKWPELKTPEQLKRGLPEARKAFERCKKEQDFLTPQRLVLIGVKHVTALAKQLDALGKDDQDDVEQLKIGVEVADELSKLITEVTEYLKKK